MPVLSPRCRQEPPSCYPVLDRPESRRSFGGRLASAVRRRAAYAWSRLTVGDRQAAAEACFDWLARHGGEQGVPATAGQTHGCPGVTGGSIETAVRFGALDVAHRWAHWLMSTQQADGSWPGQASGAASVFNTAQAARGLLAIESELAEVQPAAMSACSYIEKQFCNTDSFAGHRRLPPLWCLPPLLEAARRYSRADWATSARRTLVRFRRDSDPIRSNLPPHLLAWWIDALVDCDCRDAAAEAMRLPDVLQRRDGSVPAVSSGAWVSSTSLAHLACCWYKLGHRDPADSAMQYLARRQSPSGGFRGVWGRDVWGRGAWHDCETLADGVASDKEVTWAAKHYLDAALLQVQAAFDAEQLDLPNRIDPADGRVRAVRRWFADLSDDAQVADVGCGKGRFLRHLATWFPAARLTGIDISTSMLAHLPDATATMRGSLLRVAAADGTFDGAFAVESLEHALLPRRAVGELCRIVRPGGRVLIIDKHLARQPLSEHKPWERWFRPEELTGWLSAHCDDVHVEPISHSEGLGGDDLFLAAVGRRV